MKLNQMLMKVLVELSSVYVNIIKRNMSIISSEAATRRYS